MFLASLRCGDCQTTWDLERRWCGLTKPCHKIENRVHEKFKTPIRTRSPVLLSPLSPKPGCLMPLSCLMPATQTRLFQFNKPNMLHCFFQTATCHLPNLYIALATCPKQNMLHWSKTSMKSDPPKPFRLFPSSCPLRRGVARQLTRRGVALRRD